MWAGTHRISFFIVQLFLETIIIGKSSEDNENVFNL